jgi:serine/threonine-protein kinase
VNGKVLGQRYQIVRLIGAGGMGSVYEAIDSVTHARVAVKLITAETAKNATLMGRFEREARAATSIDTPHIVRVLDAGKDAESELPFIVMEFLEGEDVQQLIKRLGPLPPDLALRIVAQACLGLDRAHEARIIHRDIKPANFFLAKTGGGQRVVKLLDFGIAKITHDPSDSHDETAGLTRTGSMLGSPLYMSPEQARGHRDLDRRADLWSLGVVLYQTLTARTPHQDTDALGELIIAICTEEAAPIQELAPWVSPAIAAVAHHAMRFSPEERFQTAADMLDEIRPLLPGGWAIEESMFQPLGDADRTQIAPRLVTQPDMPIGRGNRSFSGTRTGSGPATPSPLPQPESPTADRPPPEGATPMPGSSLQGLGTTVNNGGQPTPMPAASPVAPAGGARGVLIGLGAAVALGLGGFVAYRLVSTPSQALPAQPAALTVATPPAEPKPRTVKLVVLPGDAAVDVDGATVTPNDGAVEITGALGSVHKVHLKSGDTEILKEVAISEGGAVPFKIELPFPAAPSTTAPRAPFVKGPIVRPNGTPAPLPLREQR